MKVPPALQRELLAIADLDQRMARVKHRHRTLPEHDQLNKLNTRRGEIGEEMIASQTRLGDAQMEADRIEADLEPARARLARNEKAIEAGHLDVKALRVMIEESDHLRGRIAKLEDAELEAMQAIEDLEAEYQGAAARRGEVEGQMRALIVSRNKKIEELTAELSGLAEERGAVSARVPAELMAIYQRVAERQGTGAAELRGNRCSGCTLELDSTEMKRIRAAAADEVIRCSECGRLLVR